MHTFATIILVISVTLLTPVYADQETAADIANIQSYFMEKFPEVSFQDFANGVKVSCPTGTKIDHGVPSGASTPWSACFFACRNTSYRQVVP